MKKETEKIDELIKEALTKEEAAFYDELEEEHLFGKMLTAHKGRTGWLVSVMTVVHLLIFILFVFCTVRFFESTNTYELIQWGAGGMLCMMTAGMLKLYIWMQMDKNTILRELKRVELQIAALSSKLES